MAHTPGPWKVNGNAIEGGDMHLASVIDERDIPIDSVEVMANARLMAAAPTLLKAVKLALLEFERISYQKKADSEVIECLQKAIAKAEGSGKPALSR